MSEGRDHNAGAPSARRSDDFYRAIFEVNSAVKLLIRPSDGQIVDANRAAAKLYGWTLEELRGMRIDQINTLTPEQVREEMEVARTLERRYFNFRHRTASGDIRHVEVHSGPVLIDDEELLLSIVHDVTERNALEEQLRRSHRLESVGRLAGGVAHDFNNLLTVMLTTVDFIGRKLPSDSPVLPHVDDLRHAAHRAAELTNALLAFSRQQVLRPRAMALNQLVKRMSRLLDRTLGSSIDVQIELTSDEPVIFADPSQIEQVVMNLALNSKDAMPDGGTLTLRTSVDQGSNGAPSLAALEVTDTGVGMDATTRERVFEPFFTTKAIGAGTGLGLASVYGVVRQSGGLIQVSSKLGVGTTFRVTLPLTDVRVDEHDLPAERARRDHAGYRVLLVEDSDAVRAALVEALELAGFEVVEASSTSAALALPDEVLAHLDAVATDVLMPGRSGIELADELLRTRPDLPVLLMSGHMRPSDRARLPDHVQFLAKPFRGDELVHAIDRLLRR